VETTLALGQALLRSGQALQARPELMAAVADARRRGDTTLLAEAALLVGDAVSDIAPDRSLLALLDEALAAHDLPVGTRVRLEARRAMVTFWTPGGVDAAREAAARAVADGQAAGDGDALGAALIARQFTLRGPDDPAERIAFGEQVRAFAERRGDEELRFRACRWLIPDLFHRGDVFAATTTLDVAAGIAEARRDPRQRWWALVFRALLAGFRGRARSVWCWPAKPAHWAGASVSPQPTSTAWRSCFRSTAGPGGSASWRPNCARRSARSPRSRRCRACSPC
jgi:hypothetical protein